MCVTLPPPGLTGGLSATLTGGRRAPWTWPTGWREALTWRTTSRATPPLSCWRKVATISRSTLLRSAPPAPLERFLIPMQREIYIMCRAAGTPVIYFRSASGGRQSRTTLSTKFCLLSLLFARLWRDLSALCWRRTLTALIKSPQRYWSFLLRRTCRASAKTHHQETFSFTELAARHMKNLCLSHVSDIMCKAQSFDGLKNEECCSSHRYYVLCVKTVFFFFLWHVLELF